MTRRQVLLLASEFPPGPGGIGAHAHHLAIELCARGWDVSAIASQEMADDMTISRFNRSQPYAIHRLRRFGNAPTKLLYRFLVATIKVTRNRPVLIIASGERMVWLAALLHHFHHIPFLAVGHAMEFNVPSRVQQAITKRCFEAASAVVCVSEYTRNQMRARGISPAVSEVIPNGADNVRFRILPHSEGARFREEHRLVDATLLITVGSVHERKGQDIVIRALPMIRRYVPDVHYLVVGMPTRRDAFEGLARQLEVGDRVHFLGAVSNDEVVRALNAADLFLMTSQHTADGDFEGFGIAVVEAALCGRAAVVSGDSGVVEAIEAGETGLVASISDPQATAARVVEILADRTRLADMGLLAHTRAIASKTWSHRGAQYNDLVHRILSEHQAD